MVTKQLTPYQKALARQTTNRGGKSDKVARQHTASGKIDYGAFGDISGMGPLATRLADLPRVDYGEMGVNLHPDDSKMAYSNGESEVLPRFFSSYPEEFGGGPTNIPSEWMKPSEGEKSLDISGGRRIADAQMDLGYPDNKMRLPEMPGGAPGVGRYFYSPRRIGWDNEPGYYTIDQIKQFEDQMNWGGRPFDPQEFQDNYNRGYDQKVPMSSRTGLTQVASNEPLTRSSLPSSGILKDNPYPTPSLPAAAVGPSSDDVASARAYLAETAHPGSSMSRQGVSQSIAMLNPTFAVNAAKAVRMARDQGMDVGISSSFRTPNWSGHPRTQAQRFDATGASLHSYGLASDFYGLDNPTAAQKFNQIAIQAGLYNPYGWDSGSEYNHYQAIPDKSVGQLRSTLNADGSPKLDAQGQPLMWAAAQGLFDGPKDPMSSLAALGYSDNGKVGPVQVRQFQEKYGLTQDGILGPKTRQALTAAAAVPAGVTAQAARTAAVPGVNPTGFEGSEGGGALGTRSLAALPSAADNLRAQGDKTLAHARQMTDDELMDQAARISGESRYALPGESPLEAARRIVDSAAAPAAAVAARLPPSVPNFASGLPPPMQGVATAGSGAPRASAMMPISMVGEGAPPKAPRTLPYGALQPDSGLNALTAQTGGMWSLGRRMDYPGSDLHTSVPEVDHSVSGPPVPPMSTVIPRGLQNTSGQYPGHHSDLMGSPHGLPALAPAPRSLSYHPRLPYMEGEDVRRVQEALVQAGFSVGPKGLDGRYGADTAAAVRQFQLAVPQLAGRPDAIAGPLTQSALYFVANPMSVSVGGPGYVSRPLPAPDYSSGSASLAADPRANLGSAEWESPTPVTAMFGSRDYQAPSIGSGILGADRVGSSDYAHGKRYGDDFTSELGDRIGGWLGRNIVDPIRSWVGPAEAEPDHDTAVHNALFGVGQAGQVIGGAFSGSGGNDGYDGHSSGNVGGGSGFWGNVSGSGNPESGSGLFGSGSSPVDTAPSGVSYRADTPRYQDYNNPAGNDYSNVNGIP